MEKEGEVPTVKTVKRREGQHRPSRRQEMKGNGNQEELEV